MSIRRCSTSATSALAELLDRLGFDEFWCGEHHSSGWETIPSPEMFLAAAAQRTHTIRLGTGVVSLPYHHPFNVAQRMVQLDHMTRGRAMFGSGPGALPSDARTLGIDPIVQRDRQDEALGVIIRLLRGDERFSHESEWFTLREAELQVLPVQEQMPMTVASSISPSGMQLAGKYGIGALSIASTSTAGIQALPTQWGFAEESAAQHGQRVDRQDWRVLMAWHIAETREQARGGSGRRAPAVAQRVQRLDARPPRGDARRGQVGAARADHRERRGRCRRRSRRNAGRPRRRHRRHARDDGRVRRRARLRPRLGELGGHATQLGSRRPLRHPRGERADPRPAGLDADTCTTTRPSSWPGPVRR